MPSITQELFALTSPHGRRDHLFKRTILPLYIDVRLACTPEDIILVHGWVIDPDEKELPLNTLREEMYIEYSEGRMPKDMRHFICSCNKKDILSVELIKSKVQEANTDLESELIEEDYSIIIRYPLTEETSPPIYELIFALNSFLKYICNFYDTNRVFYRLIIGDDFIEKMIFKNGFKQYHSKSNEVIPDLFFIDCRKWSFGLDDDWGQTQEEDSY